MNASQVKTIFGEGVTELEGYKVVSMQVAEQLALLHGIYWMDRDALQRGNKNKFKQAGWILHDTEELPHLKSQMGAIPHHCERLKDCWEGDKYPKTKKALDSLIANCKQEKYLDMYDNESFVWTLEHGDPWSNNILWDKNT